MWKLKQENPLARLEQREQETKQNKNKTNQPTTTAKNHNKTPESKQNKNK